MISGIKDIDREILGKLDDRELLKACSIDSYTWNTVCDDAFLRRRLLTKYPEIEQYKLQRESWKQFFLRAIRYIALLKEKYGYDYTFGNFVRQKKLLSDFFNFINQNPENLLLLQNGKNRLLMRSAEKGELAIVEWCYKNRANIHIRNEYALRIASNNGHLEIVKYLLEKGADIHEQDDGALRWASRYGHLEIVKYLVEHGADIHALNDYALTQASINRHFEVVKYLKSKM